MNERKSSTSLSLLTSRRCQFPRQVPGLPVEVLVVVPSERAQDAAHGQDASLVPQLRGRLPALDLDEEALDKVHWDDWEHGGSRGDHGHGGGGGARHWGRLQTTIRDASRWRLPVKIFYIFDRELHSSQSTARALRCRNSGYLHRRDGLLSIGLTWNPLPTFILRNSVPCCFQNIHFDKMTTFYQISIPYASFYTFSRNL